MAIKEKNVQYAGPDGNQVQAAGALIFAADTGNVLIVYRSSDCVDPNLWCGAGGKIEPGEDPMQASRREIEEELGYKGKMTGHGFRAVASTILNETGFNSDVIERQLAHCERNEVRGAYNRAEYLPERKRMMQHWADYLDSIEAGAKVIPLHGNAA